VQFPMRIYAIPAAAALCIGVLLVLFFRPRELTLASAMAVGALSWFGLSVVGALPYWLALDVSFLDAFFEATSGFTTTGATVLSGLSLLPKSLLLWRALTQWIGGLGIFTLFLVVIRSGGWRHLLMGAETHKAASERFSPGIFQSLQILWFIYGGLTLACALALWAEGLGLFDAVAHAMTTLSTGGFSTYDDSIGHFAAAGYPHAGLIETTIMVFMFLGGTSFLVHWNLLRRRWRAVTGNRELRAWIVLLLGAAVLVVVGDLSRAGLTGWPAHVRSSLFHVVSIATTTGFTTQDLASTWFSPLSRQVFLLLMLIGGCIGSTSGGLKVWRVTVLAGVLRHRLRVIGRPPQEVVPLTIGRRSLGAVETERAIAITVAWLLGVLFFWFLGTLLSRLGGWESLSAALAMIGNVGPNYIPVGSFARLGAATKVLYIVAMVAGRLEVLPFLLLFSRRTWR
jgi:trk system potassium uptake protein TrkH